MAMNFVLLEDVEYRYKTAGGALLSNLTGDFVIDNTSATGKIVLRLGTNTSATGFEVRNNSDSAIFSVNGAGTVGNLTVDGTNAATFTINEDGAQGTNEDPGIIGIGGDGGTDLMRFSLRMDSSADHVYLAVEKNPAAGGYGYISPVLHIGRFGETTVSHDAAIYLNTTTDAGVAKQGSIVVAGQETLMTITGPGILRLSDSVGYLQISGGVLTTDSLSAATITTSGALALVSGAMTIDPTGDLTISMDATKGILFALADGVAAAFHAYEGANSYIKTVTSNDAERVEIGQRLGVKKGFDLQRTRVVSEDFTDFAGATLKTPWAKDLQTSATGDFTAADGLGAYQIALTAANQADAARLLGFSCNISFHPLVKFGFKIVDSAQFTSVERFAIGVVNALTNAEDNLDASTVNAWFRAEGAAITTLLWESDDNTVNNDDQATGITLVNDTYVHAEIDFATLSAVKFRINGATVGTADMSAISANTIVKAVMVLQRDDNTQTEGTPTVAVDYFEITSDRS